MIRFHPTRPDLLVIMGLLVSAPAMAQICTREYAPVCGQLATETTPRTFPNSCMLKAAQATLIKPGTCDDKALPVPGGPLDAHGCKTAAGYLWHAELASCVRPGLSSTVTLQVAAKRRPCSGMAGSTCLQVRELVPGKPPQKWTPYVGEINGFTHVPGQRVTLRVRKDQLDTPTAHPADTTYTLLQVLP